MTTVLGAASGGQALTGTGLAVALAVIVLLVVLAGFFAMAETSLTRITRIKAVTLEEEGSRGAEALTRIVGQPERYINPILLLVLVCHTLLATLVGVITGPLGAVGVAVGYVAELIVIFVLAESGPKTFAVQRTEKAALLSAPVIARVAAFLPIRLLTRGLIGLANLIYPGSGSPVGPSTSEEELLALAEVAMEESVIEGEERALIHSIIEFGDTVAREVMVARPDMLTVEASDTADDVLEVALLAGKSRIPVQNHSVDDIVGIVFLKDLVRAVREGQGDSVVATLVRPAKVVPETKRVAELLREMQIEKSHMAIVVDEYGGVAGLVTLEDLIEELVGEIVDEYDVEEPDIVRHEDGTADVAGSTPVDELNDELGLSIPEDEDWETLGGYLFHRLGHVPEAGEEVETDGHVMVVKSMSGNRIERVVITPCPPPEEDGAPRSRANGRADRG